MTQRKAEDVVKDYLKAHGFKQRYIAESIGVKDYTMSDIFNHRREMKLNELVGICIATKSSPDEILAPLFEK